VRVKVGGRWRDVGRIQVAEGHALWLPNGIEWAWNREYSVLAQRAAKAQRNLYDPDYCGQGPAAGARLRLWVNWDANSNDSQNVNDEWIRIKNLDPTAPVRLGGWTVRDSEQRYRLPASAVVPAGGTLRVHVGRGSNHGTEFFWGLREPVFDNATEDRIAAGDGAYLVDPQGDLRAFMIYPCRVACSDPYQGRMRLDPSPGRGEHVTLTNVSNGDLDLEGYLLRTTFNSYAFGPNSVVHPGETLRLDVEGDPSDDTRLHKHWGFSRPIMPDRGDRVQVATFDDIVVACEAWGSGRC
jgi:hypothetical protein